MSEKFQKIYDQSINNPEKFWQEASNDIFWFKKPNKMCAIGHDKLIENQTDSGTRASSRLV